VRYAGFRRKESSCRTGDRLSTASNNARGAVTGIRSFRSLLSFTSFLFLTVAVAAQEKPYILIDNFSRELPSSNDIRAERVTDGAKQGLAMAKLNYRLHPQHYRASLRLDRHMGDARGKLELWVKGNKLDHSLQLSVWHARVTTDSQGRQRHNDRRDKWGQPMSLDYEGWKLLTFELSDIPKGHQIWVKEFTVHGNRGNKESPLTGEVLVDDLRFIPAEGPPQVSMQVGLLGPATREFTQDIALFADVHNFTNIQGKARLSVSVVDRNENPVLDREFAIDLTPGKRQELRFALEPENLGLYVPPFTISGDVLSSELPAAASRFDRTLVMSNSNFLWEDFANLHGHWLASGWESSGPFDRHRARHWIEWLMGEGPRATPITQTTARISRVDLTKVKTAGEDGKLPPGRYAMRLDYRENAEVYNARSRIPRQTNNPLTADRFLPGNAFRVGVWVRGDGSNALLQVVTLDYSNMADFWAGGWRRTYEGLRDVCRLDFKGWRYIEVSLPGNGRGSNERKGSTVAIDFPLEVTGFRVQSWQDMNDRKNQNKEDFSGTIYLGPITTQTQMAAASSLSLLLGYDDVEHEFAPENSAWLTVQNSSLGTARTVGVSWAILDRDNTMLAKGEAEVQLDAGKQETIEIKLGAHAAALAEKSGPFRLQATAFDSKDASVSAVREIVLSQPDSRALIADFESDRPYYAYDRGATPAGTTSTEKPHSGKRSLAVTWSKEQVRTIVAIDPPIPGPATELTVWVHGDKSGALLYPVLGDARGVPNGLGQRQFDLFLGRTTAGDLQNALKVDWSGWKEVRFQLPQVPIGWDKLTPVRGYLPSYPFGLHLAIDASTAEADEGKVYFDDIFVRTHLPPQDRLALGLEHDGIANTLTTEQELRVRVESYEVAAPRQVEVRVELSDWRRDVVARFSKTLALKPASRTRVPFKPGVPMGAYRAHVQLLEAGAAVGSVQEDILITDLKPHLGDDWSGAMRDEWRLRGPLRSVYTFISEDWDWLEHYPGNTQTRSARLRAEEVRKLGGDPWMLLGYSAYYASGIGMEQFKSNAFNRRGRDIGHAVDVFLVPERIGDWDNYVNEMMRGAGKDVSGWVVWNNPDARSGSLAVKPEYFAELLASADKWRRLYCPERPLVIGGMTPGTAIPYLNELAKHQALEHLTGINVRLDVGVRSPEDAEVPQYVERLRQALKVDEKNKRRVLLTDLDWAVEKSDGGLDESDQAAYLVRSALLLEPMGIRPEVSIRNGDYSRIGLGLTYKNSFTVPPHKITSPTLRLKAGWLGLARLRRVLAKMTFVADVEIQDVIPLRTRCLLFRRKDGVHAAFVWRNNDPGTLSAAATGLAILQAEDLFGTAVKPVDGSYAIGKMPVMLLLETAKEDAGQALTRLHVKDGPKAAWPQRTIAIFTPQTGQLVSYKASGGKVEKLAGRTIAGEDVTVDAVVFPRDGKESFTVAVPENSGLVLRKRFVLDDTGQMAEVLIDGKAIGNWDVSRSDAKLSSGFRESIFVISPSQVHGNANIEVRYQTRANTVSWCALAYQSGAFPLSAVGAVHVDQAVSHPRMARNMAGEPMKIGEEEFVNGIGVFAPSLIEISLNKQFKTYQAKVGIDAATEGRGSVVFEIYADGERAWKSPVMSGLEQARDVEVDVTGVNRLRLVVTDGGDGNRLDAANWCTPELHR